MATERLVITQPLCVTAKYMIDKGASVTETARMLGVSQATISRIRAAGYDLTQFNKNTDERRIREKDRKADRVIGQIAGQLQGQMKMELNAEEKPAEMSEQAKMMRFMAGQVERLAKAMAENNVAVTQKLDRLNDTMSMILRAVRKEV